MLTYTVRRVMIMIPTLLVISILVFVIIQLPPGDFLTNQIAELQAQGEAAALEKIEFLRQQYGLDRPMIEQYAIWAGIWPGENGFSGLLQGDLGYSFEFNLPVADVVGDRVWLTFLVSFATILFTWAGVVPDRRLFGHPPVQLGRPHADLHRLPGTGHAQLPAGAGAALPRQRRLRHLDRRADGSRISRAAMVVGQGRLDPRASVDPGGGDRHLRHGRDDPAAARQPARRAAEAICRHRPRQGPAAVPAAAEIPLADVAQPLHRRHRQPAAADHLRRGDRVGGAVAAHHRADAAGGAAVAGPVPRRIVPDAAGAPDRGRHVPVRPRAGRARPAHPPRRRHPADERPRPARRRARALRLARALRPARHRGDDAGAGTLFHGVAVADDVVEAAPPPSRGGVGGDPAAVLPLDPRLRVPGPLPPALARRVPHLRPAAGAAPVPRGRVRRPVRLRLRHKARRSPPALGLHPRPGQGFSASASSAWATNTAIGA